MSAATATRSPSAFWVIVGYTLRTSVPQRKILLLIPTLGAVLFGMLSRGVENPYKPQAFAEVAGAGIHGLILPIACLVIGDAILGAEVRAGTFSFTWLSPVRHSTIVLGRWLGGCIIAWLSLAPAVALAAIAAGSPKSIGPAVLAAVAGSAAYLALFIVIGAGLKRPIVWSLVLVILIERLLGTAIDGIAQLTPGWLAQGVLEGLSKASIHRPGVPHGWSAVARLIVVAGIALAIATRQMKKLKPASASE